MADYDDLSTRQLVETATHINGWQKLRRLLVGGIRLHDIDDGDEIHMASGSYNGNGGATQTITGLSFQPRLVLIWTTTVTAPAVMMAQKSNQDGTSAMVWGVSGGGLTVTYSADMIVSLDAGGFTVGDGTPFAYNFLNDATRTYKWVAIR